MLKKYSELKRELSFFSDPIFCSRTIIRQVSGKHLKIWGCEKVRFPAQLMVALDHNSPPANERIANDYREIRDFAVSQHIGKFYDSGQGVCHQLMSYHAKPGMLIVGSDSHSCTAGAFNCMAVGIDRTEAAAIWKTGESWFMVPESLKVVLSGKFNAGVFAKDLALWICGMIGSAGANYLSVEFHGPGLKNLSVSDRMTLANMASETGAKNAVFPADDVLLAFLGKDAGSAVWADEDAVYVKEISIQLEDVFPVVAVPPYVDQIVPVSEVAGTKIQQGLIGTCTNGRYEDMETAANILDGKSVFPGFQLIVVPASAEIYLKAIDSGIISKFLKAGATILSPGCGPCMGTGQGIPADGFHVISSSNRNFTGRMGNKNAFIYLASPAMVAISAIYGEITDPRKDKTNDHFPFPKKMSGTVEISKGENRKDGFVWNYSDADNLSTDQMFAGNLTYQVKSTDANAILPHLFKGFDVNFAENVRAGDLIIAGENFGCGSSREHPAVGLAFAGVKAVIVKSVNRIFYRSTINQGLLIIVNPEIVDLYKKGDNIDIQVDNGSVFLNGKKFQDSGITGKN